MNEVEKKAPETEGRTSILNGRRLLFGYHIEVAWESQDRKSLALKSISWVNPDQDTAGQVDLVSVKMLDNPDLAYWLVSYSHSIGDSFELFQRAEIVHADIFDRSEDALSLVATLASLARETSRVPHYVMPDNGWVSYRNDGQERKLDLSHLDGIFDRLDGVFLIKIQKEQVTRWAFEESKSCLNRSSSSARTSICAKVK